MKIPSITRVRLNQVLIAAAATAAVVCFAASGPGGASVYLIEKSGKIVYSHFGDGSYATTEKKIPALLAEPAPSGS